MWVIHRGGGGLLKSKWDVAYWRSVPDEGNGHVNDGTKQRRVAVPAEGADRPDPAAVDTVPEVAEMLGYGPTKVRMMCITGDLRSLKDGGSRRILPAWVDEYVAMRAAEAEADWP